MLKIQSECTGSDLFELVKFFVNKMIILLNLNLFLLKFEMLFNVFNFQEKQTWNVSKNNSET